MICPRRPLDLFRSEPQCADFGAQSMYWTSAEETELAGLEMVVLWGVMDGVLSDTMGSC
jgi:hypothetical protein